VFGYIQAADDPESQIGFFGVFFSIAAELIQGCCLGWIMGMIGGFTMELLRQLELKH